MDNVSLSINTGETHGIVGESGSGKTTFARLILKLSKPSSGRLFFKGADITDIKGKALKHLRKKLQIIFQDPYSSLDPRKTIFSIISEPLVIQNVHGDDIEGKVVGSLELVNLPKTKQFMKKYPDELSGGQRQRVGIARTLTLNPELIVLDEPVSMLDASIKAGIINLINDVKIQKKLTCLFITHELALAYYICDRISVMHRGRIVESGISADVIKNPIHPYTRDLIESIPPLLPDSAWMDQGQNNTAKKEPTANGCGFLARCRHKQKICREKKPELKDYGNRHMSACHMM